MSRHNQYLEDAADRVMITDLLARYVWAADYGSADEWANVFTPDGIFGSANGKLRVVGRERLKQFLADLQRTVPHLHHVSTSLKIELDGDRATGKCELNEFLSQPGAIYPNIHGWYEDEYVFDGERWLIKSRLVHQPHPENAMTGVVGAYFQDFWEVCRNYRD
jgi:hypothetical protein